TTGVLQTSLAGSNDAFVTKLNADASAILYSTYLGGKYDDFGAGIALYTNPATSLTYAYVTGMTNSPDFPTFSAVQPSPGGGYSSPGSTTPASDAFVTKLNPTGSGLVFSTYLGGGGEDGFSSDGGSGIVVDASGNAYVTGATNANNF